MTDRLKEMRTFKYILKTLISNLNFKNSGRHLHIRCISLLSQEFTASRLPQGQQLDVVGEEAMCADGHLESKGIIIRLFFSC